MGEIWAGVGGERWEMLERVLERLDTSVVTCATTLWLYEAWELEGERDEVRDRIWRAWRASSDSMLESQVRFVQDAVDAAVQTFDMHDVRCSDAWRGYLGATLLWAMRVSIARGIAWERVSLEVRDGISWPGQFTRSLPGKGSANDVVAASTSLLDGEIAHQRISNHEAGHWIVKARMMSPRGEIASFSGEMLDRVLR